MLTKARHNAEKSSIPNVTFVSSRITSMSLPSSSADVVISNCVINLVPDAEKPLVFQEIHRLLKPGGRLAVSDILLKKEIADEMKRDMALYVGCVAGASRKEEYERWMREAGFEDVVVADAGSDLNVYVTAEGGETAPASCCGEVENMEAEKGCCGTASLEKGSGCCVRKEDGGVVEDLKGNFRDVDLNELAGESCIFRSLRQETLLILLGSYKIFAVRAAK
jgi:arsenite methyltransferase